MKKSRGPPLMGSRPEKSEPENLPLKGTKPSGAGPCPRGSPRRRQRANLDGEEVGVLENLMASLAVEEDLVGLGPDAAGDAGLGITMPGMASIAHLAWITSAARYCALPSLPSWRGRSRSHPRGSRRGRREHRC